ncbi:hypothetical protein Goklo_019257, partial [Gossypium klotzschianum]|nr:hypothetical protein [Gossypium klotzschianum]
QVHNLPHGLISKTIAKQLGDFIGRFIDYDARSITNGVRSYMQIRVRMDDISLKMVPYRETVGMSIWLKKEGDFRDVGRKGMDGNVMHEDGQILIADGKKRPKSYSNVSLVSFHKDSNKISGELINASQSTRSAELAKQSVQKFQHMLNKINPQVVFLIETKLDVKRMKWIQRRCGFGFGIDIDISTKGLHGDQLTMGWK